MSCLQIVAAHCSSSLRKSDVSHLGAAVRHCSSAAAALSQHRTAAPAVAAGLIKCFSMMLRMRKAVLVAIFACQLTSAFACLACFVLAFSACTSNNACQKDRRSCVCDISQLVICGTDGILVHTCASETRASDCLRQAKSTKDN